MQNYAELAHRLHREKGFSIALIGAAAEQEECEAIEKAVGQPWLANLCGRTSMHEIVPLCEECGAVIANDTGTGHIAACAATPILVLCGPTDPCRVKPAGPNVLALQFKVDCRNCYCKKPCNHQSCMKKLTPDIAFTYLEKIMANPQGVAPAKTETLVIC